ncbi:hypothetical protein, partial [Marinilabilia salmonicolor]
CLNVVNVILIFCHQSNGWRPEDAICRRPMAYFITQLSPVIYQPDILFIGINPGQGAFIENYNNGIKEPPVIMLNPNKNIELDWFKDGNARANKKNWKAFKWYERDKSINNIFVANLIDLLYFIAEEKYGVSKTEKNQRPNWYEDFGKKIMFTNLYPIATKNTTDLMSILNSLSRENELKQYWLDVSKNEKKINNWIVRKYFIKRIYEIVNLTSPKIIVCLGMTSYNDFTFSSSRKKIKINTERKNVNCPIIGFSRKGNWSNLIPEIAKEINKHSQLY